MLGLPEGAYLKGFSGLGVGNTIIEARLAFRNEGKSAPRFLFAENARLDDRFSHNVLLLTLPTVRMSQNQLNIRPKVGPQKLSGRFPLFDIGDGGVKEVANEICK